MYKPTIGLEIHAELNTESKMFCSCSNNPDEVRPNFNICEICTAQPGTLPVANEEAIKKVIKTGLALNCNIAEESKFDRKNYFYPDIPKGYQISQYDQPLCGKGFLEIDGRKIGITRIHLEEDTGSLLHPDGADYSLVNFNRAGVPLMELVTEPDITSGLEAKKFAEELQLIFKYLGVSDADMEKGLMRVEVNISVSKTKKFGTKVEIKNLNSFKVVQKAIDFEIARQTELLEEGGQVVQETRGWHDKKEITFSQREKEYGLEESAIEIFVANKDLSEYFEKAASEAKDKNLYKLIANYLISDVQGLLAGKTFIEKPFGSAQGEGFKITPENFAEFIAMIHKGEINSKTAKMVLAEMFNTGGDPSQIVEANNWGQMKDDGKLEEIIKGVIDKNPKAVADYKAGNKNTLQFLAGQVMAATRGTANPQNVQEILKKLI